jgi:hypothetical protein
MALLAYCHSTVTLEASSSNDSSPKISLYRVESEPIQYSSQNLYYWAIGQDMTIRCEPYPSNARILPGIRMVVWDYLSVAGMYHRHYLSI